MQRLAGRCDEQVGMLIDVLVFQLCLMWVPLHVHITCNLSMVLALSDTYTKLPNYILNSCN